MCVRVCARGVGFYQAPTAEDLRHARVIVGTCAAAEHLSVLGFDVHSVTHLLIDEAAQVRVYKCVCLWVHKCVCVFQGGVFETMIVVN